MQVIRAVVDSRIRFAAGELPEALADRFRALTEHANKHYWTLKRLRLPAFHEHPIERTWEHACKAKDIRKCDCKTFSFPRGVLPQIQAVAKEMGVQLRIVDMQERGVPLTEPLKYQRALRWYQEDSIQKMLAAGGGILRASTGSGKTSVLIALAARLNVRSLVIVHSSALLSQWQDRVRSELGIEPGLIQGKISKLKPVTIAMQKTLWSRGIDAEIAQYFGAVLADECFVSGTQILLSNGDLKPIESIKVGDTVAVGGRVVAIQSREYEGELIDVDGVLSTPNHPYAAGSDWCEIGSLNSGVELYQDGGHANRMRILREEVEAGQSKRAMRVSSHGIEEVRRERDMPSLRQGYVSSTERLNGAACEVTMRDDWSVERRAQSDGRFAGEKIGRFDARSTDVRSAVTYSEKDVEVGRLPLEVCEIAIQITTGEICEKRGAGEVACSCHAIDSRWENHPIRWSETRERERERECGYASGKTTGADVMSERIRARACYPDEVITSDAQSLHIGFREYRKEDCIRNRWFEPLSREAASVRRTERCVSEVERLASLPLPNRSHFIRSASRVRRTMPCVTRVYNFETENGVYVAGGKLVHNCHMFAAKSFKEVINNAPQIYRFGASADQRRKDGKEYLIHDVFGPVVSDVNRDALVLGGFVVPVDVVVHPTELRADWYGVPSEDGTGEQEINVSRLRKELAADATRNEIALTCAAEEAHAGKVVFMMAHEREHCRYLASALAGAGISVGLLLGGPESKKEFDAALAGLRDGSVQVGVGTYQAIGTGIDVPSLDAIVCVTPIASNKQFFGQVIGRACRPAPGKTNARMHYIWDQHIFGKRAVQNMCSWNDGGVKIYWSADNVEDARLVGRRR